ncbi:MAG: hypothetical protein D6726_11210, partial [Nitrospirae bacterium]
MDSYKAIEEKIGQWRDYPEVFDREAFEWEKLRIGDWEGPTEQQQEASRLVGEISRAKIKASLGEEMDEREEELSRKLGISIKSGHGTGKDAWLARTYLWAMLFPMFTGMVTAPTSHQLESVLWKEIRKWLRYCPVLRDHIEIQSDKMFWKGYKGEWFVEARTANVKGTEEEQGETLAGRHGKYMILAVDESSGVPRGVYKPIEGAMTGFMNFAILIGNPTRSGGYFFDTHTKDRERWVCLTWSSEDSPLIPEYLLEEERKKYGWDSNWYRVRRRGEFPKVSDDTLIPYDWVMAAIDRDIEIGDGDAIIKGIDVGAGGDKSIILTRQGRVVTDIKEYDNPDTMKVTGWIMRELSDGDYDVAFIDPIGLGAGVYDRLVEMGVRNLYPVDYRDAASEDNKFFRLRDELIWKVREAFESGLIKIPDDDEFIGELTNIKYDVKDSKGVIKIESKRELKARGVASPNKLDALAMTYYWG